MSQYGNSFGSIENSTSSTDENDEKKSTHVPKSLQIQSSFGDADPIERFRTKIFEWIDSGMLPPKKERRKYQIYTWSQGSFRHESVVIGCYNDHDQDIDNKIEINHKHGFITMELKVDIEQEKVFPDTKFFTKKGSY